MSNYQYERYEHKGYTITIDSDDDAQDPRGDDNATVMLCWHPRYNLGDEHGEAAKIKAAIDEHFADRRMNVDVIFRWLRAFHGATTIQPLYLLDHSGLSMSTSPSLADPGGWDTSAVGFVFDTEHTRSVTGVEPENVPAAIAGEVKSYSTYLEGGYVGWTVLDHRGEVIESCWGYDDLDCAKADAEATVPGDPDTSLTDAEALDQIAAALCSHPDFGGITRTLIERTGRKTK